MVTLGTTAPVESVTVPTMVAVVWAQPDTAANMTTRDRSKAFFIRWSASIFGFELIQNSTAAMECFPPARQRCLSPLATRETADESGTASDGGPQESPGREKPPAG